MHVRCFIPSERGEDPPLSSRNTFVSPFQPNFRFAPKAAIRSETRVFSSLSDAVFKGRPLARCQVQSMLGSTIQHIGGVRRPFCLAQVTRFPLIKIAAEVGSEIHAGARRPQKLPGARSVKPGAMTDQLVWQAWIFVPQIDREILEGAGNVTARKARVRGPCRR